MLALLCRPGALTLFFGVASIGTLVLAMGKYGPPVAVLVAEQTGALGLRSPGRFLLLFALAMAVLAGLGADYLDQRAAGTRRRWPAVLVFVPLALVAAGAGLFLHRLQEAIAADLPLARQAQQWVLAYISQDQLGYTGGMLSPASLDQAWRNARDALSSTNPRVQQWALLMAASIAALGGLILLPRPVPRDTTALAGRLRRGGVRLALRGAALVVLATDLILFGQHVHPRVPLERLAPASDAARYLQAQFEQSAPGLRPPYRVYTRSDIFDRVYDVRPNALAGWNVADASGYSSLQMARHAAFQAAAEYSDNHLLDLWVARYLVVRATGHIQPSYGLLSFHPQRPLLSAYGGGSGSCGTR